VDWTSSSAVWRRKSEDLGTQGESQANRIMNTQGKDELRELLAAEYVLGTLRGPARRRFEAWLKDDADLRATLVRWQTHLAPLDELVAPVTPPARVWDGLVTRLPVLAPPAPARLGWFESLAFWKGLAGALAVLSVLAVAVPRWRASQEGVSQTAAVEGTYLATLEEDKTHRPVAIMVMSEKGDEVIVQLVGAEAPVPKDRALQLWMANPAGQGVVSAGVAPAGAGVEAVRFKVPDAKLLRSSPVLGLSLEPPGGSPSATHVLGFGKWTKVSS